MSMWPVSRSRAAATCNQSLLGHGRGIASKVDRFSNPKWKLYPRHRQKSDTIDRGRSTDGRRNRRWRDPWTLSSSLAGTCHLCSQKRKSKKKLKFYRSVSGKVKNLVVKRSGGQVLFIGRLANSWHWVHSGIGDVLEIDGNVPLPNTNRFVIRSRNEAAVVVNESNCIDWIQVTIILLKIVI